MPYKVFAAGEEALASDVNNHLMSQTLSRHASASARAAAITAPVKGQMTILDTDVFTPEVHTGSAWVPLGGFYMRYIHQTGFGNIGSGVSVGLGLPMINTTRAGSFSYDLMVHITNPGSGNQSATFQLGGGSVAATYAPVSVFSLAPFLAISIPLKAFYRNVPAGSALGPSVNCQVGTGGISINVGAISGSVVAFPPNSEY